MSLINDALKRARQVQPLNLAPQPIPRPLPTLTAVEVHPHPAVSFPKVTLAIVLVILATVIAQWLWIRAAAPKNQTQSSHAEATTGYTASTLPAVHSPGSRLLETNPVAIPRADIVHVSAIQEPRGTDPEPGPDFARLELPRLKLQAIIYNPAQPSAMINGQTLFLGDSLDSFKLVRVTTDAATLQGPTGTTILRLQ